ncbi:hypothetical protein GCM10018955_60450 [Planomonospora venezuelensis]
MPQPAMVATRVIRRPAQISRQARDAVRRRRIPVTTATAAAPGRSTQASTSTTGDRPAAKGTATATSPPSRRKTSQARERPARCDPGTRTAAGEVWVMISFLG